MHAGWKVGWAGMVTTSPSQSLATPQKRCYQGSRKQNYGKGRKRKWNSKQALETIFYLNRFTSHRATKTWGSRKLFYSNLFSSTISSISKFNDSKWFTSESFISLFIQNHRQPKSKWWSPQTEPNLAGSQHLMTTLNADTIIIYNIASKVMQFWPSNFLTSSACSIILWMNTDDTMKPLKCMSVTFQRVWRFSNLINYDNCYYKTIGSWLACICWVMDVLMTEKMLKIKKKSRKKKRKRTYLSV